MTAEQNKAIVRRFFEAFEANDQAAMKEVLAPDLVAYTHGDPTPAGRDAMLHTISDWNASFETHYTIEEQIADGDRVATRLTTRAVHNGREFQGVPPTGKQAEVSSITIERIKDGQIVERRVSADWSSMMQQLGLVPPQPGTRSEENKALVRRMLEESDRSNGKSSAELLAPDFTAHIPGSPPMNSETFQRFLQLWYADFSDWSHTLEDLVAEGDRVAFRYSALTTHTGEFMGVPATGKRISVVSAGIARIAGGRIAEWWNFPDLLGFMQQLGLVPPPQASL